MIVAAIIAHYGEASNTITAVSSLAAGTVTPSLIVVVDNQDDLSGEVAASVMAAARGVSLDILRPGENVGFAGAAAIGARRALAAKAEWVWFVNNDADAEAHSLQRLLAAGAALPSAGLLSPLIVERGTKRVWFAGGTVRCGTLEVRHSAAPTDSITPYRTQFVTGCVMLARASMIRHCGPPDASLFMYYEDVDWSLRQSSQGWCAFVVPTAVVHHAVARVEGRRRFGSSAVYYMTRNRLLLASRYGTSGAGVAGAVWWGLRQIAKERGARPALQCVAAFSVGCAHGVLGRRGRMPDSLARLLR